MQTETSSPTADGAEIAKELEATRRALMETEAHVAKTIKQFNEERERSKEERDNLLAELHRVLHLQDSESWRAGRKIARVLLAIAPAHSVRRKILYPFYRLTAVLLTQGPVAAPNAAPVVVQSSPEPSPEAVKPLTTESYHEWIGLNEPDQHQLVEMARSSKLWSFRPLISILLPAWNTPDELLREAIDSVLAQVYDNWELCLVDDHSSNPSVTEVMNSYVTDARIKVAYREENGGIAVASQTALDLTTGEYVMCLDHDDTLAPFALYELVSYLQDHRDCELLYSDEDHIEDGVRCEPGFKPAWSPQYFLGANYICHVALMRTEVVREVGGFRTGFDGAQDYDLLLRFTDKVRNIGHVAKVLYHWRKIAGSTALDPTTKPAGRQAGRAALEEALARRGIDATVRPESEGAFFYHVRPTLKGSPTIDILIPHKDRADLLSAFISSIEEKTTYKNYRITIIDNGSTEDATKRYLEQTRYSVVHFEQPFHYPRIMQAGFDSTVGEYILLANNDLQVITPEWLEILLEYSQYPDVGAVGCHLLYPDGRTQHGGVAVGKGYVAHHIDQPWPIAREVSAVTAAVCMVRREVLQEVGGLGDLRMAFNDIDFCLRLRQAGYRVIYTPEVQLYHLESGTRGAWNPTYDSEVFISRWGQGVDPYMNPNVANYEPKLLRMKPLVG